MIPTAVLRHTVQVEPYEGTNGAGTPTFGPPTTRRGWIAGKRTAVRTADGVDVIASATCLMRPPAVPVESRVTRGTATYTVLDVQPATDYPGDAGQVLILEGPR